MTRSFAFAVLAAALFAITGGRLATAEEPKATGTVDLSSSVPDAGKLQAFEGVGVIVGQKEWERLAAAWGIKEVPKMDFSKEILLIGTWRGSNFKFLGDVKAGNLTVELVGDKDVQPGFRCKVLSLQRAGITKFQGADLPAATASELKPIESKLPDLSGAVTDTSLQTEAPVTGVVTSQEQWDRLVKVWGIKDSPRVDFTRQVLVVGTSRGSSFELNPVVTNGDLVINTKATRDLSPGFRWRAKAINREGIRTIQGKEFKQGTVTPNGNPPSTNPNPTNPLPKNPPPQTPPPKP